MLELTVFMSKISKIIDDNLREYEKELKILTDEKDALLSAEIERLSLKKQETLRDLIKRHGGK